MSDKTTWEVLLDRWRSEMEMKKPEMPGWDIFLRNSDGDAYRHVSGLFAVVSFAQERDGNVWLHLSASYKHRVPSHAEMVEIKNLFIGRDVYAYAVFPPAECYVDIHKFCLHLWHRPEIPLGTGCGQVLPEFSGFIAGFRSI